MPLRRRRTVAVALLAIVTLVPRLWALRAAGWDNLTPDSAHYMNLARSIERGLGFVSPETWPAWLDPARLPIPETIKEPGYPYALAAVTRLARDPVRAGQWISLVAGLLLPFATWWLVRALEPEGPVGLLAALLVAGSPLLITQSVYVMSDSLFALLVTVAFALAAARGSGERGDSALATGVGLTLGLAYLVRAQAMTALPVVVGMLVVGRPGRAALSRLGFALATLAVVVSPWMLRNMRLFGGPIYSNVVAFGIEPYVDPFTLYHGLDPPPAPLAFALGHPAEVARYTLRSAWSFGWRTLPHDLLGSRIWLALMVLGAGAACARWRAWWPVLSFAVFNVAFLLPLLWLPRYFSAFVPAACALAALGAIRLIGAVGGRVVMGRVRVAHAAAAALAALSLVSCIRTVRHAGETYHPEWSAARAWGPWLSTHLAPGEAVMASMTSYWAWASDRHAVQAVVTDEARLKAMLSRLHVRYAAMTPEFEREYASRLPAGRLPDWIRPLTTDPANGIAIYEVRPD